MKTFQFRWAIFLLSLYMSGSGAFADSIPDGATILAKVLEARQSIQGGHVEVKTSSSGRGYQDFRKEWNIWCEGDTKKRSEVVQGANTTAVCLDCYAERTELYYTTQPLTNDPDTTMALVFYDGYGNTSPTQSVPNPRWFGCLATGIEGAEFLLSPLEIYGSKAGKYTKYPAVESDVQANVDCWKVSFTLEQHTSNVVPDMLPYTIWVDKSDTSRLLRVESRVEVGGNLYINSVDSESEKYQNKIWFPTKLTYKRTVNGTVVASQEAQVKVISLNEPLHEDTFSPKGISFLKPGTPVAWAMERDRPAPKEQLVWNGKEVVAEGTFELEKVMAESVRFKPINLFLMLVGIALILFGIGLHLWKKYGT